jgi:hypothetical protein
MNSLSLFDQVEFDQFRFVILSYEQMINSGTLTLRHSNCLLSMSVLNFSTSAFVFYIAFQCKTPCYFRRLRTILFPQILIVIAIPT